VVSGAGSVAFGMVAVGDRYGTNLGPTIDPQNRGFEYIGECDQIAAQQRNDAMCHNRW
jgi:hypothetical protein